MLKRLNELNFVIGLFFAGVGVILLLDVAFNNQITGKLNLYTGIAFLIFGVVMILIRTDREEENDKR